MIGLCCDCRLFDLNSRASCHNGSDADRHQSPHQYHHHALGLDRSRPRLTWEATSADLDQEQSAWQITITNVDTNALVWDSGKSGDSSESGEQDGNIMAVVTDIDLAAHGRFMWQVRLWNQDHLAGPWSEPCHFALGFLPGDPWPGTWISHHLNLSTAVPALRHEFAVADGLVDARLSMACRGIADCFINGSAVADELFVAAGQIIGCEFRRAPGILRLI